MYLVIDHAKNAIHQQPEHRSEIVMLKQILISDVLPFALLRRTLWQKDTLSTSVACKAWTLKCGCHHIVWQALLEDHDTQLQFWMCRRTNFHEGRTSQINKHGHKTHTHSYYTHTCTHTYTHTYTHTHTHTNTNTHKHIHTHIHIILIGLTLQSPWHSTIDHSWIARLSTLSTVLQFPEQHKNKTPLSALNNLFFDFFSSFFFLKQRKPLEI